MFYINREQLFLAIIYPKWNLCETILFLSAVYRPYRVSDFNFPFKKIATLNLRMCLPALVTSRQRCLIIAVREINMHLFYKD